MKKKKERKRSRRRLAGDNAHERHTMDTHGGAAAAAAARVDRSVGRARGAKAQSEKLNLKRGREKESLLGFFLVYLIT